MLRSEPPEGPKGHAWASSEIPRPVHGLGARWFGVHTLTTHGRTPADSMVRPKRYKGASFQIPSSAPLVP